MLLRFIMILLGVNSFNINSFFRFFFKNFSTSSPIFQIEIAKFRKLFFFIEKSLFIFLNHLNKFLFADIVNISPFFNHTFANASFWLLIFSSLLMSILNKKIVYLNGAFYASFFYQSTLKYKSIRNFLFHVLN